MNQVYPVSPNIANQPWKSEVLSTTAASKNKIIELRYTGLETIHTAQVTIVSTKPVLSLVYGTTTLTWAISGGTYAVTTMRSLINSINRTTGTHGFVARATNFPLGASIDVANIVITEGSATNVDRDWVALGVQGQGIGVYRRLCNPDWAAIDPLTGEAREYEGQVEIGALKGLITNTFALQLLDDEGVVLYTQIQDGTTIVQGDLGTAAGFSVAAPLRLRGPVVVCVTDTNTSKDVNLTWRTINP